MKKYKNILFIILALIVFTSVQSFAQKDTTSANSNEIIYEEEFELDGDVDLYDPPEEVDKIFIHVQHMPEFPGGIPALRKWVAEHVNYPEIGKEGGISGTVYLRFEVKKDGGIGKIEVQKGVDPLLDEEAIKVIKKLPKFKPGEQNGKKVNVWFSLPIIIHLN